MNEPRRRRPRCYNPDDVKDRICAVFASIRRTRSGQATANSGTDDGKKSGYALIDPVIRLIFTALGCVLVLLILPSAITVGPEKSLDSELRKFKDPFGLEPEFYGTAAVIYSAKDDWGESAAEYLAEQLEMQNNLASVCIPDTEFSETSVNRDLIVSLGCSQLNNENYLDSYLFLGKEGLEITDFPCKSADHALSVTAFSSVSAREASDLIINAVSTEAKKGSAGRIFAYELKLSDEVYVTRKDTPASVTAAGAGLIRLEVKDRTAPVFVISYPDADAYTLNALELAIRDAKPALVVFNGGLSCGARDRNGLFAAWNSISALLSDNGTPWCFTLSDREELPRETIADILTDMPGCLNRAYQNGSAGSLLALTYNDDPFAAVLITDPVDLTSERSASFCSRVSTQIEVLKRAGSGTPSLCAVLPGVLPALAALISDKDAVSGEYEINSDISPYILPSDVELPDLYAQLGINTFFSFSGTADGGYASYSDPSGTKINTFFCGSIGFSYPGIGGKFEVNNSLRGGILADLSKLRSDNAHLCVRRLTASEIGANKKSEG